MNNLGWKKGYKICLYDEETGNYLPCFLGVLAKQYSVDPTDHSGRLLNSKLKNFVYPSNEIINRVSGCGPYACFNDFVKAEDFLYYLKRHELLLRQKKIHFLKFVEIEYIESRDNILWFDDDVKDIPRVSFQGTIFVDSFKIIKEVKL